MRKFSLFLLSLILVFSAFASVIASADGDELLSLEKEYTVEYAAKIDNVYPKKAYKESDKFTDGVTARPDPNDGAWLELYRGCEVSVTIDLGEVMSVRSASVGELQKRQWGIYCSRELSLSLSENGEDFGTVAKIKDYESCTSNNTERKEFVLEADKSYKARYVKVTFSSDVITYVDEISVFGKKDTSGETVKIDEKVADKGFAKAIDGIRSVCLMYTAANYDTTTTLPYVAYVDNNGNPKAKMFDALLYLAITKTSYEDGFMRPDEMKAFVDDALSPAKNIGALNTVVSDLKEQGIFEKDEKYPIFLSVPYVGIYAGCDTLEKREAVIKDYVDYAIKQFKNSGYDNLELKGLYWFGETVEYGKSSYEEDLIRYFNDYTHSLGYKTIWIPYYGAAGINKVDSLGFDAACLQSGYAFGKDGETGIAKQGSCDDAAAAAKKFGLGLEFEVDHNADSYYVKFADYVHVAYQQGLMDGGMMMMYQSGHSLYYAATGKADRKVYDLTYEYCSGEYAECAPEIKESEKRITVKAEGFVYDDITVNDADTPSNKLKAVWLEKPEGLYILVEGDGFIQVEAYGTAPGEYKGVVAITDGGNQSNPCTIIVTVEPNGDVSTDASDETSSETSSDGKEEKNLLPIILISASALLVIAAAVVIIIKKAHKK